MAHGLKLAHQGQSGPVTVKGTEQNNWLRLKIYQ